MTTRATSRYSLLTLEKGLVTLELIADTAGDTSLTELSDRLKEPVSVVFRVVRTLLDLGYVQQDPITKRYSLGLRAWELGEKAAARLDIVDAAQPLLNKLTRATGETASLAIAQNKDYLYVATADGLQPLRAYVERGSRISLTAPTASARAILAFSDEELVDSVLSSKLKRLTPATVIDPSRIRTILSEVRDRGVAIVHGENQQQLSAVAAPIINAIGNSIGAIALSGVTQRFEGDALLRMVQLVKAETKEIEKRMRLSPREAQLIEISPQVRKSSSVGRRAPRRLERVK